MRQFIVALLVCCWLTHWAHAGDWPGLRGPEQSGVAQDEKLAESWPADGPRVLWSRPLGQGYSSFAIRGNRAWTQYQSAFGQYVICLDRDTGETVWEFRCGDPYELMGIYPGPRSTPAIDGEYVYFTTPDGEVGCLNAETGKPRWVKPLQAEFKGEGTEFGYSASPVIRDQKLFLPIGGADASVVAMTVPSGEIAWKSGSDPASYASSMPISLEGHQLLVTYLQNHIAISDRTSGHLLWRSELSSGYDEHSAMPVYREPILVFSAPFQAGSTAFELTWAAGERRNELRVRQCWHQPRYSHDVDSAVIVDDTIYGFDLRDPQSKAHRPSRGEFRAVNVADGQILWSSTELGQCNLIAAGDRILAFNDAGELLLFPHDRTRFVPLGRVKLFRDEVCWTPPALSGGVVLVRTHSLAMGVYVGDPAVEPAKKSTPTVAVNSQHSLLSNLAATLLQGEREHPFMRPEQAELMQWYWQCMIAAGVPWLLSAILAWKSRSQSMAGEYRTLALIWAGGVLLTPILNRFSPNQFAFTWPVSLFAAFQAAVLATQEVGRVPEDRAARRHSRLAVLAFLLTCGGYFWLLRQASLPHEWGFLLSFIPSLPLTIWTARMILNERSSWQVAAGQLAGFSAGFWGAVLIPAVLK